MLAIFRPVVFLWLLLACAAPAVAQHAAMGQAQTDLHRAWLKVGGQIIEVQLAQTPVQQQIGLMHRTAMPANEGMLFIFERAGVQCFWMRNTRLPLTAAFVADDGTIVNLADMQPMSDEQHCSMQPVRYVLEMNQGWFGTHGVKPGMRLRHPAFAASARQMQPQTDE